jgi:integrase
MARRGDGIYLRGKTWWLDFVHRGGRHVLRLGKGINRTVASELAQVQRAAILKAEAGIGGPPKGKDPLFDDAVKEFVAWAETNRKPRTARDYREILEQLKATFGGRRLGQIDELSIERHKRARLSAPAAANRELGVLKSLYHRCRDDLRIYDGPTPRIKLLKANGGRLRFLETEEIDALLLAAREPMRTLLMIGIYTGIRIQSEALTLRWADIDIRRGLLTVQSAYAKSGKTRTVPLNRPAVAALRALRERTGDRELVFAGRDGSGLPVDPDGLPDSVQARRAQGRDASCAAAHLRVAVGHDRRAPAGNSGLWRLERPHDGAALYPLERQPQGRGH